MNIPPASLVQPPTLASLAYRASTDPSAKNIAGTSDAVTASPDHKFATRPLLSPVELAKAFNLQEPKTLVATVLNAGILTEKFAQSIAVTQPISSNLFNQGAASQLLSQQDLIQQQRVQQHVQQQLAQLLTQLVVPTRQAGQREPAEVLTTASNGSPNSPSQAGQTKPFFWIYLGVTQSASVLLVLHAATNEAHPSLPQIGNPMSITLTPKGDIRISLPDLTKPSHSFSSAGYGINLHPGPRPPNTFSVAGQPGTTGLTLPYSQPPTSSFIKLSDPRTRVATSEGHAPIPSVDDKTPLQNKLRSIIEIVKSSLNGNPNPAPSRTVPINVFLNQLGQLQSAIDNLQPSVRSQLMPKKLLEQLLPIFPKPSYDTGASIDRLIDDLKHHLVLDAPSDAILGLQQARDSTLKMLGANDKLANDKVAIALISILRGLPFGKSDHSVIQDSRAAIATWLQQEISAQLVRLGNRQISNVTANLDSPEALKLQQEIPLKFGNEFGLLELKIAQRDDQHQDQKSSKGSVQQKQQRWTIFMTFDIPVNSRLNSAQPIENASLSAEVDLCETVVNLTFWSTHQNLLKQIAKKKEELEEVMRASGIQVKNVLVHSNPPPLREVAVQQTRVDIRT
jgi:hypothetical protein